MENSTQIIGTLALLLLSAISYFLKVLHKDVKQNIKNTEMNTASIALIQSQQDGKIDRLAERTELQIQQLTESVKALTSTISHMNNNVKNTDTVLSMLIKKFELGK